MIGYARVSTQDQNLDLQILALKKASCRAIYCDYGLSGRGFDRPGLEEAMSELKSGGKLLVWRLDRLGRSLPKLIQLVDEIGRRGAEFCSLTENIDTSSSGGRLVFHMMAALAEFERSLISERTKAGMEAARHRGVHVGRRPILQPYQIEEARFALRSGERLDTVAARFHISARTLQRHTTMNLGSVIDSLSSTTV